MQIPAMLAAGPDLVPPIECLLVAWVIFFVPIAMGAGAANGRMVEGFFYGLVLGPLGVIAAACLPPSDAERQRRMRIEEAARLAFRREIRDQRARAKAANKDPDAAEFAAWRQAQDEARQPSALRKAGQTLGEVLRGR